MKFVSTGTPAASRSRRDLDKGQAGFTLLEALVALALVLSFASVLGPHLSQARRIMDHAEGRVAAQVMLRSLLDAPFDRSGLAFNSAAARRFLSSIVRCRRCRLAEITKSQGSTSPPISRAAGASPM